MFMRGAVYVAMLCCLVSCKKTGTSPDNENKADNPPSSDQQYGYVVVYTNDYVYTDPVNGATTADQIDVSIDNVSKGKMTSVADAKIYYGSKNTVSVKVAVGNIAIKTTTTSGATRLLNATIVKNDTTKVKVDYGYKDPNSNSYYIEYYDNGMLKKYSVASTLSNWFFYVNNYSIPNVVGSCINSSGNFERLAVNYSTGGRPFDCTFLRPSSKLKPNLGSYTHASGSLNVSFEGAVVSCNISGSYAKMNISEVKVVEDMGLEKRGYYSGTFDAVVYQGEGNIFGNPPVKHVITNGRFVVSMKGISFF